MSLSNGVSPHHDTIHDPVQVPYWSESFAWWTWDNDNDVGLYCHFQRHPDDVTLWRGYCVAFVSDQLFIHHSYGRQFEDKRGPGYASCHIHVEEPHRRWRLRVDGGGIQRSASALYDASITDGPAVPMTIDVALEMTTPVWDAGHGDSAVAEIMAAHFEQKGWCTGSIRLGDKTYAIDCPGANDHSFGPRHYTKLFDDSGFFNCVFPSGRSLTGIVMSPDSHLGYLDRGDGIMLPATRVVLPQMGWAAGGRGTLMVEAGDVVAEIAVEVTKRRAVFTMVPPNFEHVGLVDGDQTPLIYVDLACKVEWDGEVGAGSWESCRNRL